MEAALGWHGLAFIKDWCLDDRRSDAFAGAAMTADNDYHIAPGSIDFDLDLVGINTIGCSGVRIRNYRRQRRHDVEGSRAIRLNYPMGIHEDRYRFDRH
jgi:hypothetical protein